MSGQDSKQHLPQEGGQMNNKPYHLGKRKLGQDKPEISQPAPSQRVSGPSIMSYDGDFDMDPNDEFKTGIFAEGTEAPAWHNAEPVSDPALTAWLDGGADRKGRRWKPPVAAIFIHAGAGYHSTANERIHLQACSDAARTGMTVLKSGHSAVDAVEAAIRVLEDKEITNAGYGSNLSIDGTVECDATVVDHYGRSGACGAVPNIKNPISLAKMILDSSNEPLSLRRVPPNLLVGNGAKDFAWEKKMPVVPNELLISRNALDRYNRWREDLERAKLGDKTPEQTNMRANKKDQRDHTNAILTGMWNEGQPDSPGQPSTPSENGGAPSPRNASNPQSPLPSPTRHLPQERGVLNLPQLGSTPSPRPLMPSPPAVDVSTNKRPRFITHHSNTSQDSDGQEDDRMGVDEGPRSPLRELAFSISESARLANQEQVAEPSNNVGAGLEDDNITDTVGAIAIDQNGLMAAASSSGGIGMKFRGRVGPAALVGIGTAIVPVSEDDPDGITVGSVTSGTGEHMATTMAAQKCAERLYHGTRRGPGGVDVPEDDESAILQGFVINDFQQHPGVKYSTSAGAIGVMSVKKAPKGYYLYFAHNTDSFALASMSSRDREPYCVMSRLPEGSSRVAQGGRKISVD
ncbi:N-terminal nucleophile aminohydrolase [Apiospora saccharicola]|uniref:N-terminal nucleophile aminohydrolase n=1 Tax=Apiospora saccharicola TaxID=335842 RepID=A0ABR1W093_9PEZI